MLFQTIIVLYVGTLVESSGVPVTTGGRDEPQIRLRGSQNPYEGLVEVYFNGRWGTICGREFTHKEATVLCKQLNYKHGLYIPGHSYGITHGPVLVKRMRCAGNETNLYQCELSGLGETKTDHSVCAGHEFDVGIKCFTDLALRILAGQDIKSGKIEVRMNGEWGTICSDNWTDKEAQVVCNMLAYRWGKAFKIARLDKGKAVNVINNVHCTGSEWSLLDCSLNASKDHNCQDYGVAGVSCYDKSVRLLSRGRTDMGTVEIRRKSGWIQVCDEKWSDTAARVLCKELGHVDGRALSGSALGLMDINSTSNISMTRFRCIGIELRLNHCGHMTMIKKCNVLKRASAICYNKPIGRVDDSFAIKLVHGNQSWGAVNVRHLGVWGQVCSSGTGWNDLAAKVACKQMGFQNGRAHSSQIERMEPVWITELSCTGKEQSLSDCVDKRTQWGHPVRFCPPAYASCY